MELEEKRITIKTVRHKTTGLLVAMSDEMKGLYVHARSEKELLERIPVAIRAILEANGCRVISVYEVEIPSESLGGFIPSERKFDARFEGCAAA
jgi:hypothetical protein